MTDKEIEMVIKRYNEGASYSQIAALLGRSESSLKHWLRSNREKYGLVRRRDYKDKTNAVSVTAEAMCTWNLKLSIEFISKRWGRAA
jgi:transposase